MVTSVIMQYASLALFALGSLNLIFRGIDVLARQARSYRAIPFPRASKTSSHVRNTRAVGAMVGVAVGDALGQFRESLPVRLTRLRYGNDVGLSRGVNRFGRTRGAVL